MDRWTLSLVPDTKLYKGAYPYIGPSVFQFIGLMVHWSVCPSVRSSALDTVWVFVLEGGAQDADGCWMPLHSAHPSATILWPRARASLVALFHSWEPRKHSMSFKVIQSHLKSFKVIWSHSKSFEVIGNHSKSHKSFQVFLSHFKSSWVIKSHLESFKVLLSYLHPVRDL